MSTPAVFLVDELPAGDDAVLDGSEGRHAATVLRLRTGDRLTLSDGRGAMAGCLVVGTGKDRLSLRVVERHSIPRASPRIVLVQALVKGRRGELAIELATEAGVDAVVPWRASHCVARWDDGPRGARALSRWRDTVAAAAKQARRAWLPEVEPPAGTDAVARRCAEARATLVLHESASMSLTDVPLPGDGDVMLVVGPEGGIADEELAVLCSAGARAVRLGPQVLRSSTAAAVALGALGVLTDRWSPWP